MNNPLNNPITKAETLARQLSQESAIYSNKEWQVNLSGFFFGIWHKNCPYMGEYMAFNSFTCTQCCRCNKEIPNNIRVLVNIAKGEKVAKT